MNSIGELFVTQMRKLNKLPDAQTVCTLHAICVEGKCFPNPLFGWLLSRVQSQDRSSRKGKRGRGGVRASVCVKKQSFVVYAVSPCESKRRLLYDNRRR